VGGTEICDLGFELEHPGGEIGEICLGMGALGLEGEPQVALGDEVGGGFSQPNLLFHPIILAQFLRQSVACHPSIHTTGLKGIE
jgi:hypothetical protein